MRGEPKNAMGASASGTPPTRIAQRARHCSMVWCMTTRMGHPTAPQKPSLLGLSHRLRRRLFGSFVGVSLSFRARFLLLTLGNGDRRHHIGYFRRLRERSSVRSWAEWIRGGSAFTSQQNRAFMRVPALRGGDQQRPSLLHRWGTGRSSIGAHGTIPRHGADGSRHVRIGIFGTA